MLGAAGHEADDLVQEALLIACDKGRLDDSDADARAFLRGIAKNLWLRTRRWWQRRREREIAIAVDELWLETADADDGEALIAHLHECMTGLQPRTRRALQLHYHDGITWPEVARAIGLTPNGTKTLVQRARAALRTCIERSTP
jgi:RNA polymerase sigma-70 factor (ECF subfamily)